MKRSLWLIFATLVLLAAAALFRYQPDRLARADPPRERLADVTVRQDLVTVPLSTVGTAGYGPATERRTRVQASATRPSPSPAAAIGEIERATPVSGSSVSRVSRDATLFEKARRAFVGDGRHRPEPFPRPRGN